jgi:hypothetical protein
LPLLPNWQSHNQIGFGVEKVHNPNIERKSGYQDAEHQNIRLPGKTEEKRMIKPDVLVS